MEDLADKWLIDFVSAIFGAYDPSSGRRLIREFFLEISKKNTKSTSAALIMLTALIRNWRKSAEFLVLAPTKEVADNCFFPARDAVKEDPELDQLLHVSEHTRTIKHRTTKAILKVVAADSEAVSGKKATGVLVEELWLFGKKHNAQNMLREATGGLASRPEGFVIYLTTQSDEPPAGVFLEKLTYARKVRDGAVKNPRFLPVLYEFPEDIIESKDYLDPENFYMTNPNLGKSVDLEYLVDELEKAQEVDEKEVVSFCAKHLNVEVGLALRSDRWPGADYWDGCKNKKLSLEVLLQRSEVVEIGLDGGGLDDLLGLCIGGRDSDGKWLLWHKAWAHPSVLKRRKKEAPRFKNFQKQGDMSIVDKVGDDILELIVIIQQVVNTGLLDKVGIDQHAIGAILDALVELGLDEKEDIVGISQGWKLTGAIKTLERKVAANQVEHSGSKMMNWVVGNAKVEPRGNAILVTKQASGSAKIDPLMATFNVVELLSLNPSATGRSFWDKRNENAA